LNGPGPVSKAQGIIKEMIGLEMTEKRNKKKGFTLVELLTVLAIITLLVGLLLPSLSMVRRTARETKQRAMLTAIDSALTVFRNDYGDYPPSDGWIYREPPGVSEPIPYCGALKLTEALFGWDLMGFHPQSTWTADGGGPLVYDPGRVRDDNMDGIPDTLYERRSRYLDLESANVFRIGTSLPGRNDGLYDVPGTNPMASVAGRSVLCDVFPGTRVALLNPDGTIREVVNAGKPVLYFRANPSSRIMMDGANLDVRLYQGWDNDPLIVLDDIQDDGTIGTHPLNNNFNNYEYFYHYIADPRTPGSSWPYRPDSYLLITAGFDGIYGTDDDICNFGN